MASGEFEPAALLDQITEATERFLATAGSLGDDDVREPSLLPGWSRGHVLTHVARNADGCVRLLTYARTGVPAGQYASTEARAAEIEAGAGRAAAELAADVRLASERLAGEYARMPAPAWERVVRWISGEEHPASQVARARLHEILLHHVDLRAGFTPDDWPADFVTDSLEWVTAAFAARADAPALLLRADDTGAAYETSAGDGATAVSGPQSALLAWLTGRSAGDGLTSRDGRRPPALPPLH